ncbi:hypothetical protein JCM10908_004037 [Rhodotorula pacifica]|uniref:uncharacterized protein n=1 Tax=Rhodotorula pacifica TaxID=1495444 RepID=UPI00316DBF63
MPLRRSSVGPDAADQRAEPPRSQSGASAEEHDRRHQSGNNGDKGSSNLARTSRGGPNAASRGVVRGRGRGRGRAKAATATTGRGSHTAPGSASETDSSNAGGDDDKEEDASRTSPDRSLARSASRPLRPVSPELGIPPQANAATEQKPRSSSLSALSSRASSPALENSSTAHAATNGAQTAKHASSSPSATSTAHPASPPPRSGDAAKADTGLSTPAQKHSADLNPLDSLSELESSDDDEPLVSRSRPNEVNMASRSISTNSTPAPTATENSGSLSPAPKRRGRPLGSRNRQSTGSAPPPKSRRSAQSVRPGALASPNRVSSSESATPTPANAPARATRANVTLPPGYIWGVTSSRWPRKPKKGEEEGDHEDDEDQGSEADPLEAEAEPVKEPELSEEESATTAGTNAVDVEMEELKPLPPSPPPPPPPPGVEPPRAETPQRDPLDLQAASILGAMDPEPTPEASASREASHDGSVDSIAVTPKGKGKGKGKRSKKVLPEPIERVKRRRMDGLDKETAERFVAREAARARFLTDLDAEMELVEQQTHPLLAFTYDRLQDEKKQKLAQLKRYQDRREQELTRSLEAARRAGWEQWSDRKDRLRMDLYLKNHSSLKSLLDEEKVFPFFRDHPLFVNHHDLPPTGWYRGPQRDPSFAPRSLVHAGHYVAPPPVNPALAHDSWRLAPDEIEADLALFYDIDEVQVQPAPPPPPPVPAVPFFGMYGYQPPPYYYEAGVPQPSFASNPVPGPSYPPPPAPQGVHHGAAYGRALSPHVPTSVGGRFGSTSNAGAGGSHSRPPAQNGFAGSSSQSLPPAKPITSQTAAEAQLPSAAPRPRARTPPMSVKAEHRAAGAHANGAAAASTTSAPSRNAPPGQTRSPPRSTISETAQSPRSTVTTSVSSASTSAPLAVPQTGTFSSFVGRQPQPQPQSQPIIQPSSSTQPQNRPAYTQPILAAPVWPAYSSTYMGPARPSQPPIARVQPYAPASTSTPASSFPPPAARVPAPPVMPAPPSGGSTASQAWPSSSRSPNTTSSLPPLRQTLFPQSFPTGGLPPMGKPPPQPATSSSTDRTPAPLRSPQQVRPAFPSMQTQKSQPAHDPLPLPSWLRPNGHDPIGPPASTTLPGPKLPHELRAASATAPSANSPFPGVGNGATPRKSPWQ